MVGPKYDKEKLAKQLGHLNLDHEKWLSHPVTQILLKALHYSGERHIVSNTVSPAEKERRLHQFERGCVLKQVWQFLSSPIEGGDEAERNSLEKILLNR